MKPFTENPNLQEGFRKCKKCGQMFKAYIAELVCPYCREENLRASGMPYLMSTVPILEEEYAAWERNRHNWDVQVIDENGRTVWALDLAARYRQQHYRFQEKDYSHKHTRLSSRRKAEILRARGWHIERY